MRSFYLAVGDTVGRYRITGTLGHGGMGIVYSATQNDLARTVALKVLSPDLAKQPEFRRRFVQEAGALSLLNSPHIIDIYEHGEHAGCLYIATRLVNGGDLRHFLLDHGGLRPVEGLELAEQVGSALADAHDAGLIHRDIKPSNVLLHTSPNSETFVYLCDFGIAKSPDDESTPTGGPTGTLGYMAPERHLGSPASVASDIYSLGCLLYATLTGRPPYEGTDVQVAVQHLRSPVPRYPERGVVAGAVNAVLARSMAKDAAHRYGSAAEMRAELRRVKALAESHPAEQVVAGGADATLEMASLVEPVREQPDLAAEVPRGRRRRSWTTVLSAAVATVLLAGGLSVYTWWQGRPDCAAATLASPEACRDPDQVSTAPRRELTCWDGRTVALKAECTVPAGLPGLLWMFPSLERDLNDCHQVSDPTVDPSLRSWRCPVPGVAPRSSITYTEWLSPEAARVHHARRFDVRPVNFVVGDKAAGYRWWRTEPDDDGDLVMSIAYLRFPFSASMSSRTHRGLDRVCAQVTARSPRDFLGGPIECSRPPRRQG